MAWLKVDDHFTDHPKVVGLSLGARGLWLTGLVYAGRQLTDGFVPEGIVNREERGESLAHLIQELIDAGLWQSATKGYQIHDYLDFNPSREAIERDRAHTARRVAEHRANKRARNADVTPLPDRYSGVSTPAPVPVTRTPTEKVSLPARAGDDSPDAEPERDELLARVYKRDAVFKAHAAAAGLKPNSSEFRRRQTEAALLLAELETAGDLPPPDQIADMTRYVRADRLSGGIPTTPTLRQVLDRQAEYETWHAAWVTAGQPRETNADGTEGPPVYLLLRMQAEQRKARASPNGNARRDGGLSAQELAARAHELRAEKDRANGQRGDRRVVGALGG